MWTEISQLVPPPDPSGLNLSRLHFIDIAPHPRLSRLNRANQGMMNVVEMFGGVLVLRRVATSNVSARQAHPEMHPRVTDLHTVFTDMLGGLGYFDLIEVSAGLSHIVCPVRG
jgi:hypothetical protein